MDRRGPDKWYDRYWLEEKPMNFQISWYFYKSKRLKVISKVLISKSS